MDIFEKAQSYMDAKLAKAAGYYPYFLPLEDTEGTEVTIGGLRLTSPMPPAPSGARISYGPRRAPAGRLMAVAPF